MDVTWDDLGGMTAPHLLERTRQAIRRQGLGSELERSYLRWITQFLHFTAMRRPLPLDSAEIEAFLSHVRAGQIDSSQAAEQARHALDFLQRLLQPDCASGTPTPVDRARESERVLAQLRGTRWLLAAMHLVAGLQPAECVRLRVRDLDFPRRRLSVRDANLARTDVVAMPTQLLRPLQAHLRQVRELHARDLAEGFGAAWLPLEIRRKYPRAMHEWGWQYVFPSAQRGADAGDGIVRRRHLDPATLLRVLDEARRRAGITPPSAAAPMRLDPRPAAGQGRRAVGS